MKHFAEFKALDQAQEPKLFDNQLLTYKETARYLGLSQPYVRRLKQRGELPYVVVGSRGVRFRVVSLNSWIEKREIK